MKRYYIYFTIIVGALAALPSCNRVDETESNFDNVAYIENAKSSNSEAVGVRNKDTEISKSIQASLALPADKNVQVTYKADASLVAHYNAMNKTQCEPLPETFFELSDTKAMIRAGEVRSTEVTLRFKNLENLPRGTTLALPVTIADASGMNILKGSQTYYYLLKKGAPITVAANLKETALYVPTMPTTGVACGLNALGAVTMEALIRAQAWGEGGQADISTIMGIEGYFLIRLGDSNYPEQIQVATAAAFGNNWPAKDANKRLKKDQWHHIALTYDLSTHEMILYVNGKEQGSTVQGSAATMDLTRISGTNPTTRFFIGKSWSDSRYFSGEMCEARIWNVVRTKEELNTFKYEVSPDTPGLLAYWKFDEGEGSIVHDHTGNGNHLAPAPKEGSGGEYNPPVRWVPVEVGGE
jgi:hypothetical protein